MRGESRETYMKEKKKKKKKGGAAECEPLARLMQTGVAGTGLEGIVSLLSGAAEVVLTDYPSGAILATARANADANVPDPELRRNLTVRGHEWGVLTDDFSKTHGGHFSRILCADCLWLDAEHYSLARSMAHFLSSRCDDDDGGGGGGGGGGARVWGIAGFHTGRAKVASFFDVAAQEGLEAERVWERDADGNERGWVRERNGGVEDAAGRNRWLVVAVLRRRRREGEEKGEEDKKGGEVVGRRERFVASMLMQKSNRHI